MSTYQSTLKRVKASFAPKTAATARSRAGRQRMQAQVPRGFLGPAGEAKYFDYAAGALSTFALNTTGSIVLVDEVPQGTTVTTRDGRKWKDTSVAIRGIAQADSTTATTVGAAYLVWDRQPNKALASITDYLDAADANSFPKRENAQRFLTIRKWRWSFAGNNTTAGQNNDSTVYAIDEFVKLPAECIAETTSADTTGVIGNRVTGALLLITVGTTAAGTADANLIVKIRTNFRDI